MAQRARSVFLFALLCGGCDCRSATPCDTTADCPDDGRFCTVEICRYGYCESAGTRCAPGQTCDEAARACRPCEGAECVDAGVDAGSYCVDLGRACVSSRMCSSQCNPEELWDWSTTTAEGGVGRPLPIAHLPYGYCSIGCDPRRLNDECGDCADCSGVSLAGSLRIPFYYYSPSYAPENGICREHCTPSPTSTGCARAGYTCDLETSTCMEACVDDRQCQITTPDALLTLVDRGPSHPAYCDPRTGRCRTRGTPGASVGDRCTGDGDCPDDSVCLTSPGRTEGGLCTRLGCRAAGFPCPEGTACDVRNAGPGVSGCFVPCRVGAEDGTPAMRGALGGNPDCSPGLSCSWNGLAEPGDAITGSCVLAEYNDRTTPNVGAPCTSAADCDSPFGYGTCLFLELATYVGYGICSVRSCGTFNGTDGEVHDGLLPSVEIASPICDSARGELCLNLGDDRYAPDTYCVKHCDDASECAPGYACTEIIAGSRHLCWPFCAAATDCRSGATCDDIASGGECTFGSYCFCSDRAAP